MEKLIGKITHYFGKISVAVIELTDGNLAVGETIKIRNHAGEEVEQTVTSMQVDHQEVPEAAKGQSVGLKVTNPVKEGDLVYKIV